MSFETSSNSLFYPLLHLDEASVLSLTLPDEALLGILALLVG